MSAAREPAGPKDGGGPALVDRGDGPALVFAHGMQLDHRLFEPQVAALSAYRRTVAYDLRARTPRGAEPYDLYALVDDLRALLDAREIERCVLVGMSMGGFMAVRAALTMPERLTGIALIGSAAVPYDPAEIERWEPAYAPLRERERVGADRARADAELHFSARTRRLHPKLVDTWTVRIATRGGPATWHEFRSWADQDDVRDAFARSDVPVLLLHGDEDEAVPLSMVYETLALARRGRMLRLPYAAHAPNLEWPMTVNAALAAFVEEVVDER